VENEGVDNRRTAPKQAA